MEPLSAVKFVSGYGVTGFVKAFSIGSRIAIIGLLGWLIWVGLIKPHYDPLPTTTQKADKIVNIYEEETKPVFALFRLGKFAFITWDSKIDRKLIKQEGKDVDKAVSK